MQKYIKYGATSENNEILLSNQLKRYQRMCKTCTKLFSNKLNLYVVVSYLICAVNYTHWTLSSKWICNIPAHTEQNGT